MTEVTAAHTRLRRKPDRGSDDPSVIHAIVDAGLVAHLGYVVDGRPVVIPTLYGRDGDDLLLHGSAASRAMRQGAAGLPVCVTITLLDGLVLARSAVHQSANYRSVVVHGDATEVADLAAKTAALQVLTEHVAPGRWDQIRPPNEQELRATTVLRLPLEHAVAKVRAHGAVDDAEDRDRPVWAGVLPLATAVGAAQPEPGAEVFALPPALAALSAGASSNPDPGGRPRTGVPAALSAVFPTPGSPVPA